ncbi:MAG: hypothetical protein O2782_19950 [bacterium]|nr:hypothetical protein [bacterium]
MSRWFKGGTDTGKRADGKSRGGSKPAPKVKAKALTPLDRSIQEIKHLAKVGESDPERLAMLLSRLLGQEREKQRHEKETFDRVVWDIVNKDKNNPDGGTAEGPAVSSPSES